MFLRFYGLDEQPFSVTPDPRFLYMGPAQQEAYASLVYGIETGRGFMALIAAPGLGKTTLVLRLMERLRDSAVTAFLSQTHTNSWEFLKNLLLDLNVKPTGKDLSDLQGQLRDVLIQGLQSGRRIVLVIDEAQNLDDSVLEMIRMLSNFETPEAKLLQTVMVGQPPLADKLARPHLVQLRQRISIITRFPPLRADEVGKYIHHRLRVAGHKGGSLFTPGAMGLIARYSRGVPRIINNLCFNALSLGYAKGQKRVDESTLREVIADLNLESLGVGHGSTRPGAPQPTSAQGAVKNAQEDSPAKPTVDAPRQEIGSQHVEVGGNALLDRVDFSDYSPDWLGGASSGPLYSSRRTTGTHHISDYRLEALALLAIVAVSVSVWNASWLGPSLDFLERAIWTTPDKRPQQTNLSTIGRPGVVPTPQSVRAPAPEESPTDQVDVDGNKGNSQQAAADSPQKDRSVATSVGSPEQEPSGAPVMDERADSARRDSPSARRRRASHSGRSAYVDDLGARGARGKLIVQSSVHGARITINGRSNSRWVTPNLFSLAAGTYIVSVSRGEYLTWTRRVHVDEGRKNWVTAYLTSDQGGGIFIVDTDPAGMQVFIDGKPYGTSRVEAVLPAGWHVCAVLPGQGLRPVMGEFHLNPGEALTKKIRVTAAVPASAAPPRPGPEGANTGNSTSARQGRMP